MNHRQAKEDRWIFTLMVMLVVAIAAILWDLDLKDAAKNTLKYAGGFVIGTGILVEFAKCL